MANEQNIANKEAKVNEVAERIKKSQSVVLVDYRGLTVEEDTNLRNELRKAGVYYEVIKNSIVERATKQTNTEDFIKYLAGPSAFAFGMNDPVAPAKVLADFIKKTKKMEVKGGIVNGKVVNADGVKALAELPPREVLIAKLLGSMNAPITGLVTALSGNIRNLLYALNAVAEKKQA
jgi:large subunit ribosomal protein L10